MRKQYSVIIPIYNAERTIKRCVDSLIQQDCSDVEIILVNDGSQDASGAICRAYAAEYNCIFYIEKENGGVSAARNTGLDAASGEYVLFVDSDDYVADSLFAEVRRILADHSVDLLQLILATEKNGKITSQRMTSHEYTGRQMEDVLQQAVCDKSLNSPCAKVYRRDLIEKNHIRFPLGISIAEDRIFNIEYALQIQSYMTMNIIGYYATLDNDHSLSRGKNDKEIQAQRFRTAFEAMIARSNGSPQRKVMFKRAVNFGYCRTVYHDAKLLIQDHVGWLSRQIRIGKRCDEINKMHMKYPRILYCTIITLPVRLRMTWLIDTMMLYAVKHR